MRWVLCEEWDRIKKGEWLGRRSTRPAELSKGALLLAGGRELSSHHKPAQHYEGEEELEEIRVTVWKSRQPAGDGGASGIMARMRRWGRDLQRARADPSKGRWKPNIKVERCPHINHLTLRRLFWSRHNGTRNEWVTNNRQLSQISKGRVKLTCGAQTVDNITQEPRS